MPTDRQVEAAAKVICAWIRYSWDGVEERDISDRFSDWAYNGVGSLGMQGGKPALRRVARAALEAAEAAEQE